MYVSTIRPGLLVHLSTTVSGNVQYRREDITQARETAEGTVVSEWNTEKTIRDADEQARAEKVRSDCRAFIAAACINSGAFGLLCPLKNEQPLRDAITQARDMARAFNAGARITRVDVRVMTGRIAASDTEATKDLNAEISSLLDRMESGVRNLDVEAIRDAAKRAKTLSEMVSDGASEQLQKAIDTARSAARTIVKAGETAAQEIDYRAIKAITESRTAFIDLDEAREMRAPAVTGRALDLETTPAPTIKADAAPVPQLDLI